MTKTTGERGAQIDRIIARSVSDLFRTAKKLRALGNDVPLQQVLVLLYIASKGSGCTQAELREALDMAASTASRNIAALSKVHRLGKEGLGLIDWFEDLHDRRVKRIHLTPKGRTFMKDLLDIDED